jgi:alpha-galactosidase
MLRTLFALALVFTLSIRADINTKNRWVQEHLGILAPTTTPAAQIRVIENHDPVQPNARGGKPLRIVDQEFTRGLYCHAASHLEITFPARVMHFSAKIGVDSNEQTKPGKGSVIFFVAAGGKELFTSPVMREGMKARAVDLDLPGADSLTLIVQDAGDGIACDQADWADAKVKLEDGREMWVGDFPITADQGTPVPFSFYYGEQESRQFLASCARTVDSKKLDAHRTQHTITYTHPGGLVVRCVAVDYDDFPAIEWTTYFKNAGKSDSAPLQNIRGLDVTLARPPKGDEFVLHYSKGSPAGPTDYRPFELKLGAEESKRLATEGGRPTNTFLPYFNIAQGNKGTIAVLGWPGQWSADFVRNDGNELHVTAGQVLTHFVLHAGEEVRGPLGVLLFYDGDWIDGQNLWRRWFIAHNLPRTPTLEGEAPAEPVARSTENGSAGASPSRGQIPGPQLLACSSHQFHEMINANEQNQIQFIDRYLQEGLKLDYWWMDAGWYQTDSDWPKTGTWEVDTKRFPHGLRAISDHAHAKGVKTIVWHEPERVAPETWLDEKHPDWLLGKDGEQKLLNLGNPEARDWAIEHFSKLITEQGIDLYRQDFNIDPLSFWHGNDAPDRQGITEIKHIEGYLAFWDALLARHPGLRIDSCASGGRRNDLETLRRSVPLLRSDYILEPTGQQLHTYGISLWIPYYGTGINSIDPYIFRSQAVISATACYDVRRTDYDYETLRKLVAQWRDYAKYYLADYYPLTPYARDEDEWIAWEFFDPGKGKGIVQAFRRAKCDGDHLDVKLRGLDPNTKYVATDVDTNELRDLAGASLTITATSRYAAKVFLIRKK